ncbi:protein YgfX [Litchfieldella rifensis]|uniref:Protein YgfX n=1 Tax=Litchfieldella rifensis TaxID=762643 RepID=A0ABV7LK80_9GAMM
MPRTPVTISIAPSRLAGLVHLGMALLICLSLLIFAPPWLLGTAAIAMTALLWRSWRMRRHWQLRGVPYGERERRWQWRRPEDEHWRETTLEVCYLGPWLIALRLAGHRHWLWPDSAPAEALRDLRRVLLGGSSRRQEASTLQERFR